MVTEKQNLVKIINWNLFALSKWFVLLSPLDLSKVWAFLRCENCPYSGVGLGSTLDGSGEKSRFLGTASGLGSNWWGHGWYGELL